MAIPLDSKLYKRVKNDANEKFVETTSAYKSMWISREYKKRGGVYSGKKESSKGLKRWVDEKWVDLKRPIKGVNGKIIGYEKCGRTSKDQEYPLCRPSKRISNKTPKTYKEISKSILKKNLRKKKSGKRVSFSPSTKKATRTGEGATQSKKTESKLSRAKRSPKKSPRAKRSAKKSPRAKRSPKKSPRAKRSPKKSPRAKR
jgi:hypothetical protein